MSKSLIVSGMRSTGKLHFGHYLGVLTNWINLQKDYDCYYFVADWHALTTKFDKTDELRADVENVVLDWVASGINPEKSTIYLQSLVPEIAQLHVYLSMVTPQNWVERDPTLKDMVKILRGDSETEEKPSNICSYGLIGYPVLMTADILTMNADYVPVGSDQLAHLEISRDIARRFNNIYGVELFKEPKPKLTEVPLFKGVDGQKMGKSFHNDIKISDTEEDTSKRIMSGITDRSRMRKTDIGHPDECEVIFDYYKVFAPEKIETVAQECKSATRGCADCKRELCGIVNEYFKEIREKRLELQSKPNLVREIILDGSDRARQRAKEVLKQVKDAVKMYY
ncbi:MAG: tryptophan--tRNA ligase [bacterium]|nr:tryptophan--tRNA ligase [bacterium]